MSTPRAPSRKRIREVTAPDDRKAGAEVASSARLLGAEVIAAYSAPLVDDRGDQYTPTVEDLAADLRRAMAGVKAGNLDELEAMLLAQAKALEAVFAHFAVKLAGPWSMALSPQYAAIALKAQASSRATITALADMKRPRQANFIGQQNVAVNQQVSNGIPTPTSASRFPPIELLEIGHGERLDTRATGTTSSQYSPLEAVGAIDRATDGSRQDEGE